MASQDTPDTTRGARFEAGVSAAQKSLLQHAAALSGRTLSDFVVTSAARAAHRVIYAETARHFAPLDPGVKPIVAPLAEVPERDATWKLLISEVVEVDA
jgi:uncharacterized protein (DUF1778 family)